MLIHAEQLPLARRLVGRYLMFGLAGLLVCVAFVAVYGARADSYDHVALAAAVAVVVLGAGALVLHQSVRVHQAIERQLRLIGDFPSSLQPQLEPLPAADRAALGWNALLAKLREQEVSRNLEERLLAAGNVSGDGQRWKQVFLTFQEGLALCDCNDTIIDANNAFLAFVGRENMQQLAGRKSVELLSEVVQPESQQALAAIPGSAPCTVQLRRGEQMADGVWRAQRIVFQSGSEGENLRLWNLKDVTQQTLAEEMRNQFVWTAAHELRTPLTSIKAYAETLSLEQDFDVVEQKRFCNVINDEATRLGRFVDELLSISQMEAGAATIRRTEIEVERMLDDVLKKVHPQAEQKQQHFEHQFPPKLPKLRLDKDKVVGALVNLLGNAVKYTPCGGLVRFLVEADATHIRFHVVDTGIGISDEDLPRLGEKFFRSQDARVSKITGSGLGIAFAQEVARLHGGKLTIKSELNKGSQFTLILPIQ